jgi:hypothetical protein
MLALAAVRRGALSWRTGGTFGTYVFVDNMPVYQALSTRTGGEVISADAY